MQSHAILKSLPFKKTFLSTTDHPIEKRGFVTVPFDYNDPQSPTLEIFYRLIPAHDGNVDNANKPVVVIFNGGPGIPSSSYLPIDFDYQNPASHESEHGKRFQYLRKNFRILLSDQRGTDGLSAPLSFQDPQLLSASDLTHTIAKYFSSDFQARDYLKVIEKVIPEGQRVYAIAQSYGGMVGMQYLGLPLQGVPTRKLAGIIFSCSAVPYDDPFPAMLARRQEQLKTNLQLRKVVPDIENKITTLSNHFEKLGFLPGKVNCLYPLLGKGNAGEWEKTLAAKLDTLSQQNQNEIQNYFNENLGELNLLNYILSSCNFTPGMTDRQVARKVSSEIPFEPWMLDENWDYLRHQEQFEDFINSIDRNPPPPTPFATLEQLRTAIAENQLLFLAAENDIFVPAENYLMAIEKFLVPGHTHVQTAPGGHRAIFLEKGHRLFLDWISK